MNMPSDIDRIKAINNKWRNKIIFKKCLQARHPGDKQNYTSVRSLDVFVAKVTIVLAR